MYEINSNGLMALLRAGTRVEHESVESAFCLERSLEDLCTYLALLNCFHRVVSPLEALIESVGTFEAIKLDAAAHRRRDALARDISYLGGELTLSDVPRRLSLSECLGSLYVLEGSNLGGQIISRAVEARLGLKGSGVEYFAGEGKQTLSRWRQFSEAVDSWGQEQTDTSGVLRGARFTFQQLERSLRQRTNE